MKWTESKPPPPSWLSIADEVRTPEPTKVSIDTFIVVCMETCVGLGCDVPQAAEVTSNARNESANGQSYRCFNLYGWKMTAEYAREYRKAHGQGPPYWSAPGNKAPGATLSDPKGGDPPYCYYRVFDSFEGSLREWMQHFVPRPQDPAPYGRYRKCGELFWSHRDWFSELINQNYKGDRTRTDPGARAGAIADHQSSATSSMVRWAQSRLGLVPDGKWGPLSEAACKAFEKEHGLPVSGQLTPEMLVALARAR